MRIISALLLLFVVCGMNNIAFSELIDRGGGLIYDSDFDITWRQDANLAYTTGYSTYYGGRMYWRGAMDFADVKGWRLPSAYNSDGTGPCYGLNCTDSELGHLYSLRNTVHLELPDSSLYYGVAGFWTSTRGDPNMAWVFEWDRGMQYQADIAGGYYFAWLVHDGDIGAPPVVPEPLSLFLFIIGGSMLSGRHYLKRKNT